MAQGCPTVPDAARVGARCTIPGPPSVMSTTDVYRTLTARQLRAWSEDEGLVMRLRTNRDLLPSGHLAARVPVLVEWRASRLDGEAPFLLLRNVNYGGSPLERTTILRNVRMPLDGLAYVEFTMVPLGPGGGRGPVQHGHLRFVFKPDRRPVMLDLDESPVGADARLDDLVLSWEPWRFRDDRFSFVKALGDDFDLCLRAYAGAQRYLEDILDGHEWLSYRLRLPGGAEGARELLQVALAMGDGAARHTLARLLDEVAADWLGEAPAGEGMAAEEGAGRSEDLEALRRRIDEPGQLTFDAPELAPDELTYQTLVRSCAALARYTVFLTARRLADRGLTDGVDPAKLPEPALGVTEPWMQAIPKSDLRGLFLRAPSALRYLMRNPGVLPNRIPRELDAAGLLVRRGGKPWLLRYGGKGLRPYSSQGARHFEP